MSDKNKKDELLGYKYMAAFTVILLSVAVYLLVTGSKKPEVATHIVEQKLNNFNIKGLYIGMPIEEAEILIKQELSPFLFEGDEFMYSPFEPGSAAYKDSELLRKNIRFIQNSDGSFDLGGPFSFGYNSDNLRSGYNSIYKLLNKNSSLLSKEGSFGAGIYIKAGKDGLIYSMLFKPNFIKKSFNVRKDTNESFIKKLVNKNHLYNLKQKVNGVCL